MKRLQTLLMTIGLTVSFFSLAAAPFVRAADDSVRIDFYYSTTCPHCQAEGKFLDEIEPQYGDQLDLKRYEFSNPINRNQLNQQLKILDAPAEAYGVVPVTIINDQVYFIGFDTAEGRGQQILQVLDQEIAKLQPQTTETTEDELTQDEINKTVSLPFLGTIDTDNYSLPMLAILMGFLDGFNVYSLGALVMILGLVMSLRSRKMIAAFGGVFIATTAVVYGLLIVLWYRLFDTFAGQISNMELLIGLLAIGGAAYFIKEYWRIQKLGPTCETGDNRLISRATQRIQKAFDDKRNIVLLTGAVLTFAAIVTIVEFPCSAAVPVVFAGVLADAGIVGFGELFYIGLFVLFYMLDELIIFAIAVYKMNIWLSSPKFSKWFALAEGVILLWLGGYYLISL